MAPMEPDTHVVALCGSQRDASRTRIALGEALEAAEDAGATTELVDPRTYDLPPLDPDGETPTGAEELTGTVRAADALLLGTPVYHGSYSCVLKTALDYCGFDEFEATTVGLLAVTAGDFPAKTLEHLRTVSRTLRAWTLPLEVGIPNSHARSTFADGRIADDEIAERVRRLGEELVLYAGVDRYPEIADASVGSPTEG